MNRKGLWLSVVIGLVVCGLAWPMQLCAKAASAKTFKQEELDQLLAPIALYPDNILTPILMASTYPLEVVEAERWAKQHKSLKGDALKAALEKQSWDASVKSLVSVPDVLFMMSDKLDWTQKLGDAFLAQPKDVMSTVQKLRAKAVGAGTLKSSKEQDVKKEGDVIVIAPASPQVIYVPVYDPLVVYGPWWYPAYPPYAVYVYPPSAAVVTFTVGVAVGSAWYGWGPHPNWHGGVIVVPPPPPPPPPPHYGPGPPPPPAPPGPKPTPPGPTPPPPGPKPTPPHDGSGPTPPPAQPGKTTTGGEGKGVSWQHDPDHRKGVAYRDSGTRDQYAPTNPTAVDSRKGYRGYDNTSAPAQTSGRQQGQMRDKKPAQSGGTQDRSTLFEGMDRGGQALGDGERGRQSLSPSSFQGGFTPRTRGGRR